MTTLVANHGLMLSGALPSTISNVGQGLPGRTALVVLLLATASGAWLVARRRAARFRSVPFRAQPDPAEQGRHAPGGSTLTSADLGSALGTRATFVQFSAETCASCPQVRRILLSLTGTEPGVVHVDLDSEDHMDLVRRFSVFRTPTVLLLDAHGTVHSRSSGPLTPARALAALGQLTHLTTRSAHV